MKVQICRLWCAALVLAALLGTATLCPTTATASAKVFRWNTITFNTQGAPSPADRQLRWLITLSDQSRA
jgi:hypothetical protein